MSAAVLPTSSGGRELSNPPSDGVSNLRFSNHSDHLLVSSWDKTVRLYDASANVLKGEFMHGGPVLDCCFHDDSSGFSASADNTVRRICQSEPSAWWVDSVLTLGKILVPTFCRMSHLDLKPWMEPASLDIIFVNSFRSMKLQPSLTLVPTSKDCEIAREKQMETLGWECRLRKVDRSSFPNMATGKDPKFTMHKSIPQATYSETLRMKGQVITGSWDKTLKCWDPRGASGPDRTLVGTYPQPERVYSLSLVGHRLVVATAGRHVNVYDLRNMSQPEQRRESSLKYQTRCVRCYPNGTGFALSSVEGRVAMEFFDLSEVGQSKKYAFKCHRKSEAGKDTVYPVNAIAFHPIYGTFATGGCDGYVNVWDGNNKKRLYQYSKYPTSVAALSFSRDGRLLAVASSYTFEEGDIAHEPDAIFVRNVNEVEVKPKPKALPAPPP
ncbi:putative Mitotic checkpoint protein BUB3.1 [Cocos nucifera]|uniref:Putative Mitotic checkpoint protein BUB3.1 n=1 Tax=Cocos nucifera TaxID=13894 RepID=A0A8K0N1C4_COCNU|nr:putative Mitotic checkpoint protein BUB3.1 [Cocos nucifera]